MNATSRKVSLNLPEPVLQVVEKLAKERGTTMTEVIKAAVLTEGLLHDEVRKGGAVYLEREGKPLRQLLK
ncbi:ribbon-helix-helix protein, CopG family [Myxococcus xanthus]|uniref:Ribbon-helix-helix protein CopG domain-containing protein n=1 Tax=Myxococcus xanthus TaxID=34 RepID=A0A7Y4IPF0_MYXXA|nr:ribbon-helix-helix protein, CopG family [Myxococcus xanthus]NOJ82330.1 hypothetical protein [Myxococcus xanthus]NOJ89833.1 hypothetical protein [Myxococcus xanthus]